jgi:Fe-S cluster assembly protein SufD
MASVTPLKTSAELALIARGAGLSADRQTAFDRFAASGLPHRRVEAYHYTDLRAMLKDAPPLAKAGGVAASGFAFDGLDALCISVIDGYPRVDGAILLGVTFGLSGDTPDDGLAENSVFPAAGDPVVALNAAFVQQTLHIDVTTSQAVEKPILLRFVTTSAASAYSRVVVTVPDGAKLTLIETHEGVASALTNSVVQVAIGDDAQLEHIRVNLADHQATVLTTFAGRMGERSSLSSGNFVTGGGLSRHQVFFRLEGEGSTATISGASMLNGRQLADTTLVVDHAVPECVSREHFAHVLDDEATGVFQGKIIVRPHAQQTDGKMMSRAVLLQDGATMNNKPELEIFADDVQCGHGATVGALDDDLLFYLRARGLPKPEAEALMLQAFIGEALEMIAHDGMRERLEALSETWLKARS